MEELILTSEEVKEVDRRARATYGIPALVLMENAGRAVAEEALKMLKELDGDKIVIFCGKGNNGGDGFVAARHLVNQKVALEVYLVGKTEEVRREAAINLNILQKMKGALVEIPDLNTFEEAKEGIRNFHLIIDGLLGIGLRGQVQEPVKTVIDFLNSLNLPVLSIDIPSGLDADKGLVLARAIKARKTVTFVAKKRGLLINDGPAHAGEVIVSDIGIPRRLIEEVKG